MIALRKTALPKTALLKTRLYQRSSTQDNLQKKKEAAKLRYKR
jgi:hypothetical protein